jgi:hypothetical protein
MQFKVHMLAFEVEPDTIRMVEVPDEEVKENIWERLEQVFYYGQNDFAIGPEKNTTCSVSMADVVEIDGKYYICAACGFHEITSEEFEAFKQVDRRDRSFHALVR